MMNAIFLALSLLLAPAQAAEGSRIIRPDPSFFAHVSDFRAEWCANRICYGKSLFQGTLRVRSVLLKKNDGTLALYIEDQWPAVEMLKPAFGLVGPVNGARSEMGRARVTFDLRGEVDSLTLWLPSLGQLSVQRPTF